jgi:hypothetical protein
VLGTASFVAYGCVVIADYRAGLRAGPK